MWRSKGKLRLCRKIIAIVILWNFLIQFPVYANPLTEQSENLTESETRLYSDSEVITLIDEISAAAYEAIERAAAESAKAATLAGLEREAAILREVTLIQADAQFWRVQAQTNLAAIDVAKKTGIKNTIIAGAVCLFGGLIFGVSGTLIIGR
jgi:hypothetical protein